jgi:hypothetical protein
MKLQRLALVVLFLFVAGLVSTAAGQALNAFASADQTNTESTSSSCPDPGDDGTPCSPACPCACCPGHSVRAAFVSVPPFIQAPLSDELEIPLPDDLHPKDVRSRIFHPPRA